MPYEGLGVRHTAVATKACTHGQIVVEDNHVGTAFKSEQVDRWTKPEDAASIAVDEEFEVQVGGVHEAPLSGAIAGVDVGDPIYIDPADNSLEAASSAGFLPVGVVTEVDASRTPDVARINSNAWQAFLPGS